MNKLVFIMLVVLIMAEITFTQNQFKVLVFTKTAGYRHESILAGIEAINTLSKQHYFGVTWTEDAAIFNSDNLADYAVIIFFNTSDDILTEKEQSGLQNFVRNGGGFVGIHGASATEYKWKWYGKLVGRFFTRHPVVQTAVINVVDNNFPATYHLPVKWLWTDEWYEFDEPLVDDLKVVMTVDESTYDPNIKDKSNGMGKYHPIAWYHDFDGGRSFYTALGHIPIAFSDPWFLQHLYGGIYWAATGVMR